MTEEKIQSAEVEMEVPGSPEQVWEAIATGEGSAAWFMPAEIEGRIGGAIAYDMGGGMQPSGTVTAWEPPRRLAGEEHWPAEGDRPGARLATEFLIEARSGGTCVVRLVTSLFASAGDWTDELESMREGWQMFLTNLRLYLRDFRGQPSVSSTASRPTGSSLAAAWSELGGGLGIEHTTEGERVAAAAGAPRLAGQVERVLDGTHHRGLVVRIDEPAPGTALVFANRWRGTTMAHVALYLFGEAAADAIGRDAEAWRSWLGERYGVSSAV